MRCTNDKIYLLAFLASCIDYGICMNRINKSRRERSLVYPAPTSEVRVITGIGIPVDLEDATVIVGLVLKGIYLVPTNSTSYTNPSITYARKKRSVSRWDVYDLLSAISESYGHGGKACVLRAICETANIPVDRSNGLFEELFYTLLTPTATKEELRQHSDNEFFAAHQIGNEMSGACQNFFPECRVSYVEMFTRLHTGSFQ